MQKLLLLAFSALLILSCNTKRSSSDGHKQELDALLDRYWEERMQLFPTEATGYGDNRYNDRLTITISGSFRDSLKRWYTRNLGDLEKVDTAGLDQNDLISYKLFRYEMEMGLEGLKYPTHYMPINQFWSLTIDLPQWGSGEGNQPFKTVKDYDNFLKRLQVFPAWTDTAIANMRKGMASGWVLPEALVRKVLPQLKAVVVTDPRQSIFYGPVKMMKDSAWSDSARLTRAYTTAIDSIINPCYTKLYDFMSSEYLPASRKSSGVGALPDGKAYYSYCIRNWTTTDLSSDSIYNLGLKEVDRIWARMEQVKEQTGFKGSMQEFFAFLGKDPQFFPFSTPQQVIDSFWAIKKAEDPQLKRLFDHVPKSAFTIRQTEAFRAASASAEYNPASEDGSRPGIFYVPIINARKFNAVGMETLFLHEAIPGHHYQISLQQENKGLPKFRRFVWYGAYGEGWALYSESLGKELGVFTNPYQYFGHLSDAMHRAIRLVVDNGIHSKGMTREEAIKFMMDHERASEEEATAEIERYMAIPGQALSYKMGQLTITAERQKYEQLLGSDFKIAKFHDEVLKDGCVPLDILKQKLAAWAKLQHK